MQWNKQAGNITTNLKVKIDFTLPALSATNLVTWNFHVDESAKGRCDMILGRRVAVKIGTGGDAPHHERSYKVHGYQIAPGGNRSLTRLTSKYVLKGKTKKAKIIIRQLKLSLFSESRRCADSSYDQRAQS